MWLQACDQQSVRLHRRNGHLAFCYDLVNGSEEGDCAAFDEPADEI